jgi:hypothetical protein
MNAIKQAAVDLAGSINLTLGWRAADPAFDPCRNRYTGGVVLSQRGAEAIVCVLDHSADLEAETIRMARRASALAVPSLDLDVYIALVDVLHLPQLPARYEPPTIHDIGVVLPLRG